MLRVGDPIFYARKVIYSMEIKDKYKYFKSGDTVLFPDVWGRKKRFLIQCFLGLKNEMAHATDADGREYNLVADKMLLVDAVKRPFGNIPLKKLLRLVKLNAEAKRELKIRNNSKYV